jgi:hypothetical protein
MKRETLFAVFSTRKGETGKTAVTSGCIFQAAVEGATQTAATGDANCGHRPSMRKIFLSLSVSLH